MKSVSVWKGGYVFENQIRQHKFVFDIAAPSGTDTGPTPKEVLLSSVCGCAGMDVVADTHKRKVPMKSLEVSAQAETTSTHPKIFTQVDMIFDLTIEPYNAEEHLPLVIKAVELSMTRYCGVSAMVAPTSPIFYTVRVNGQIEAREQSRFPTETRAP